MKEEYKPYTKDQKLGYAIEELGELQAAIGKTIRWGLDSYNPELPEEEQEFNRDWIRREMRDVRRALKYLKEVIDNEID